MMTSIISGWNKFKCFMISLCNKEDDDEIESQYRHILTKKMIGICRELPNPNWVRIGHVEEMNIYPISFGAELAYSTFSFTPLGISVKDKGLTLRNGMFLVYNKQTGKFQTFLNYMGLSHITVSVVDKFSILLDAPGMSPLTIKINAKNRKFIYIPSWQASKNIKCFDCGLKAYTWLNNYLTSTDLHLIQMSYTYLLKSSESKTVETSWERCVWAYKKMKEHKATPYPDINRCIVMTRSTHDELRAKSNSLLDSYSIRPNVLISTSYFSFFEERKWKWIRIGNVVMKQIKPVPRYRIKGRSAQSQHIVHTKDSHLGIYYSLYVSGKVKRGDDVYIHV